MQKLIYFFTFHLLFISTVFSQENLNKPTKTNSNDSLKTEQILLPSLNDLIESAIKNSPLLKVNDREIDKLLEEIKIQKKSWLQYIMFDANTKYGLYNQLSISDQITGESPEISVQSNKEQFNYFAGLTFKIPVTAFTNKKNELKILNYSIQEYELKKEQLKKEISSLVVEEYYKLQNYKEQLEISQNVLQILKFNYLKSERELQNGVINITDFSMISGSYYKSEENYSKSKSEYQAQLHKLQILTGFKITEIAR